MAVTHSRQSFRCYSIVAAEELTAVCCAPPFIAECSILDTNPLETIQKTFR